MNKIILIFQFTIIVVNIFFSVANATMAQPVYYVNHQQKKCGEFISGDECSHATIDTSWTVLSGQCPKNYQENVKIPKHKLTFYKNEFCCTQGHSGGDGSCIDLLINTNEKKCAFVQKIENCKNIPKFWVKPNTNDKLCPFDYIWEKKILEC